MLYKKNVDNLLRLRILRYRQTPNALIRVKAHAKTDVSVNTFTLGASFKFADFQKARIQANASISIYL